MFQGHAAAKATHAGVLNGPASEVEQNQRNSLTGRAPFWGIFFLHRAAPIVAPPPHEQLRDRIRFQTDYLLLREGGNFENGNRMSLQLVPRLGERGGICFAG